MVPDHTMNAESGRRQKHVETIVRPDDYVTDVEDDWGAEEDRLVASCYVVHTATRSQHDPHEDNESRSRTRFDRLVLSSKDEVRQWMELEFGTLKSLMLYLASGQDALQQIVHGISNNVHVATDYSELLLSRIHVTLCGIPIHFQNVRLLTTTDRKRFETEGRMPMPRRQVIDGVHYFVQEMMGVDSYYEICVQSKVANTISTTTQPLQCCLCESTSASCHVSTRSAGDDLNNPPCGPSLFDCTTFREELRDWHSISQQSPAMANPTTRQQQEE
jgi:hypothetical protein